MLWPSLLPRPSICIKAAICAMSDRQAVKIHATRPCFLFQTKFDPSFHSWPTTESSQINSCGLLAANIVYKKTKVRNEDDNRWTTLHQTPFRPTKQGRPTDYQS